MRRHLALGAVEFLDRRLFLDDHPLLGELLLGEGADLGVFHRQDPVHHLDHRRLGAHRVIKARKFNANRARADHQQLFRHAFRGQRVLVSPDQIPVALKPRQLPRTGTGCQHDVLGGQIFAALVGLDGNLTLAGQLGLPHHGRNLVLFHQMADAARKLPRHLTRALDHRVQIEPDLVGAQAKFLGPFHQVIHLGGAQQRLGRDTAPVEADAAHMLAFDNRDIQAKLRCADRGHIAARPRPNYDQIKGFGCHVRSPGKV